MSSKTLKVSFKSPNSFNCNTSIATLIVPSVSGNIDVKISNANGHSIGKTFIVTASVPTVISFYTPNPKNLDYYLMEITPDFDLDGEFSWGTGYPQEFMELLQ